MTMETSGRDAVPQLIVKIVAGKQIKQFINPSRENVRPSDAFRASEKVETDTSAQKLELLRSFKHPESTIGQSGLAQVLDRMCVTAPSGDRSHSYIHLRRPAGQQTQDIEQERRLIRPEDWLLSATSEEIKGWELHAEELRKIEEDLAALDCSHTGTIHQSELTYVFLRWKVPLRLSTLASLLQTFSSSAHPEQVLYKELLQFIDELIHSQDLCNTQADIWKASPEEGNDSDVGSVWSSVDPGETETWGQRFQKMESALRLCDSQNTGYLEKEQARRLIQNYSQIFQLNLRPLRINEVMRNVQLHGRVHLNTVLQLLKGH